MSVLYLTQDLLFSSRVTAVAKQIGVGVSIVGSVDQLRDLLASGAPSAVIVDLEHRAAEPAVVLELLGAIAPRPRAIGYGPHVKETLLEAARTAGFDLVLSRGQFDKQMGQLLQSLATTS